MGRWLLAAAFAVAGLPFGGLVGTGVRYALRSHAPGKLPSWYGWIFAAAALAVTLLFALAALRVLGRGVSWRALWIASLVALPVVGVATLGSIQILFGMCVLLLAVWLLRRRTSPGSA